MGSFGYLVGNYPDSWLLQHFPTGKVLATSILGGFVAYGVGHIENPQIALWKYIFLILGGISVIFAVGLWFLFPDSPVDARFFTPEEKILAVKRVAEAKLGVKNTQFKWYQGMGFTTLQTTLLNAVSSGVQIVTLLAAG
ncbi:hypothetical protein TRAPUB_3979 [Trametes pubescens]|uniref:Major facilitator superfamily (MFS) profile domain-containing protein n=1 Tax=Trametes pubescens TaxID=154538 RepID=A0A1M2VC60_TRAPU|nr:hypothetical protein TRAPUB_3979 [Trametes pubescens]